ncbi:beta strand repeat-containing protein [Nitrospirillum bahiense]|uniref:Filamentous hemagglutinin family protein n=1 Tax=Nitrospirillum amazonense TaxID=28077 RepID=A0A560G3L0_9PROT|nr:GLUG motif-containing protein [Nitrospirillum amazonense]TWB28401.1 filamentous hemagglutinin family protein [Nitrospirillum amazonense]
MRDLRLQPTPIRPARLRLLLLASAALWPAAGQADTAPNALPTGGSVAAGSASISQSSAGMTVSQTSQRAVITWQDFSIGGNAGVTFQQPGPASAALNRVLSGIPSEILGKLTANGQIFIVNPAGITFGQGASVNVGGLVASTLDIANQDFMAGTYTFQRNGSTATVANQGALTAASGGYVGLLAPEVINDGVITAKLGSVVLAAGEKVTLTFDKGSVSVAVDPATIRTLIVNHQMIAAPDGQVVLAAKSADALLGGVINNTGVIEASALTSHGGVVTLEASTGIDSGGTIAADGVRAGDGGTIRLKSDGVTTVAGTLSAKAGAAGGDGGIIETSGATLSIADIHVDTTALRGHTGTWLLDPADLIVGPGGPGAVSSGTVETALATTNVTLQTGSTGSGNGDILVAVAIHWTGPNSLTLNAYRDITVSADISHGGAAAAALALNPAQGGSGGLDVNQGAKVTLAAPGDGLSIQGQAYTLVNTPAQLQAMADDLAGHYALNADLDMGGIAYTAVGNSTTPFSGAFQGLGHGIANLTVGGLNYLYVGLFGYSSGTLNDVSLTAVNASGGQEVGGIAGWNAGVITNSQVTGTVALTGPWSERVGGLAGTNGGTIAASHAAVAVSAGDHTTRIGGLVGQNDGLISASYALGSVKAGSKTGGDNDLPDDGTILDITPPPQPGSGIGGLAGGNSGTIIDSYTVNRVTTCSLSANVGGLVGDNEGRIFSSFSLGTVAAGPNASQVGGLVGQNGFVRLFDPHWPPPLSLAGTIIDSYSAATVTVADTAYSAGWGGLVGLNQLGAITNSYAAGGMLGNGVAGLVGVNGALIAGSHADDAVTNAAGLVNTNGTYGTIAGSYATGDVGGTGNLGGLVAYNYGTISASHATGSVIARFAGTIAGPQTVGGLVAYNRGVVTDSYATGSVEGTSSTGGLIGVNYGVITTSHANGAVTARDDSGLVAGTDIGGLVGLNSGGTIGQSYATGRVTAGNRGQALGGLAGGNAGTITDAYATGAVQVGNSVSGVGGLVGQNGGLVNHSFALGAVTVGNSVTGVGGLAGTNGGTITSSYATGLVNTGTLAQGVGGLVGTNSGLLGGDQAGATISVAGGAGTGGLMIGGLAGSNSGTITDSSATSAIIAQTSGTVGGLVGLNSGDIRRAWASGNINANYRVGGLVAVNSGTISDSHASGTISDTVAGVTTFPGYAGVYVGGLVGQNLGLVSNSYATGAIRDSGYGSYGLGGLVGSNSGTVTNSYALGTVLGSARGDAVGGLVGENLGLVAASHAGGTVSSGGRDGEIGGLVGTNEGTITDSYATGDVFNAPESGAIGGLVGRNNGLISHSYATGNVNAQTDNSVGGLVGTNAGTVTDSRSSGTVSGLSFVGGLIGNNSGTVVNSGSVSDVLTSDPPNYAGLLIGYEHTSGTIVNSAGAGTITTGTIVGGSTAQIGGTGF